MLDKKNELMGTSFRNPFDDYNANVLDPELIMQYWCNPFQTGALKGLNEQAFFTQKMPIILQGSRGSGKTTILKYFSFAVQQERAYRNTITIKEQVLSDHGIGFYFRCDNSFIKEFQNVFSLAYNDRWTLCFEHFFELLFTGNLIEFISLLDSQEESFHGGDVLKKAGLETLSQDLLFEDIDSFYDYIYSEIRYINKFKNESPFTKEVFTPRHIWSLYDLSGRIIQAVAEVVPDLADITYLLLIDEFENLPYDLQKMFNTFVKFCRSDVSMRIGRRSENIITTETINNIEYLRQQHDYQLVELDQWQGIQVIRPYLLGIAKKRLEAFEVLKVSSDLIKLIGDKERLDEECQRIADKRNLHLKIILSGNAQLENNEALTQKIISIISYPENRIAEMLCALWVARCEDGDDLVSAAYKANGAMKAVFQKEDHPLKSKFQDDYDNKYRYALTVLLCTAYKKNKLYYGFNDLCYLSEGNARTFINLCKSIISDALFYENKHFVDTKTISDESQSRAIRNYAMNEFNSVFSIIENGKEIREFVLSLGNVFSEYHKDRYVRYPETNQFIFTKDELDIDDSRIIETALSWGIIKKRKEPQRLSASIAKEGDIYTINRIFSPIFNISYRTRGGVNVRLSADEIHEMIIGQYKRSKLNAISSKRKSSPTKRMKESPTAIQLSFFDLGGED